MLLAGMKDPHLHEIHFVPGGNKREAWKRWGKMGNRPIIDTCGAENESCLQSDLSSLFSCCGSVLYMAAAGLLRSSSVLWSAIRKFFN